MATFRGIRALATTTEPILQEGLVVVKDGTPLRMLSRPNRSGLDADTPPEWGYGGAGPRVLAFTLLHDVAGPVVAGRLWDTFAAQVVAKWPREQGGVEWKMTSQEIQNWVDRRVPITPE